MRSWFPYPTPADPSDRHAVRGRPVALLAGALLLAACGTGGDGEPSAEIADQAPALPPLNVYTGSYPLQFFAQRIGGDRVDVRFPAPPGQDPASWSPSPEVILAYQEADLVLLNGAEYEGWTATASLPSGRVIDTSAGFADRIIVIEDGHTHSHGPEGEHSHDLTASETWLDPSLAELQAAAVRDALVALDPASTERFMAGFADLAAELRALDARLEQALAPARGRRLIGAGAGFEYLARRYDLTLEIAPFESADPGSHDFWHEVEHALGHGAERTMLLPVHPDPAMRERLEQMGIRAVVFEPLGGHPHHGHFLSMMEENLARLERGLTG